MLISLSGLPGVGKTTIARELAAQIGAVHLCIDTIEQAIRKSQPPSQDGDQGAYRAAYQVATALAEENLRLGRTVIADCVNPIPQSRDKWLDVAKAAGVPALEVEIICSATSELRTRIANGTSPRSDGRTPRWEQVARSYHPWERQHVVIDTAGQDVGESVRTLRAAIAT